MILILAEAEIPILALSLPVALDLRSKEESKPHLDRPR